MQIDQRDQKILRVLSHAGRFTKAALADTLILRKEEFTEIKHVCRDWA